ncbi:DUF3038 domain-containing protein [Leptolyngbya sp. PCC 6406]|uniref:DUF3038 domain-containing protein n=1 Tax=Leptolyngbya sp. PCC 6406 TaxID=1173264 RepID=UPI0002ACCCAB|nr:DUF3038 domain-containing protein [Leptolyngbya sp. PCC 6406]
MEPFIPSQPNLSSQSPALTAQQLGSIKAHLDLVLLALEALAGLGSEAVLEAAKALALGDLMGDRVSLWRLRQASPLRQGQGRKKLDVDEARALVLVSVHLAQQQKVLIRQAVERLEAVTAQQQPPYRVALLGDYLDRFSNLYQDRMAADPDSAMDTLTDLALKLLVDLLFYSQPGGDRRLWGALLDRARTTPLS